MDPTRRIHFRCYKQHSLTTDLHKSSTASEMVSFGECSRATKFQAQSSPRTASEIPQSASPIQLLQNCLTTMPQDLEDPMIDLVELVATGPNILLKRTTARRL